jgi:hypothetical protein
MFIDSFQNEKMVGEGEEEAGQMGSRFQQEVEVKAFLFGLG